MLLLDDISIQLFLIGSGVFGNLSNFLGLNTILVSLGTFGETLAQLFWGFHFIIKEPPMLFLENWF